MEQFLAIKIAPHVGTSSALSIWHGVSPQQDPTLGALDMQHGSVAHCTHIHDTPHNISKPEVCVARDHPYAYHVHMIENPWVPFY